jgi:hypothetical protein
MIAISFKDYFQTVADKVIYNNVYDKIDQSNNNSNPLNYMLQILKHPIPNIKFNYT